MTENEPVHIYDALKEDALTRRKPGDDSPLHPYEIFDVLFNPSGTPPEPTPPGASAARPH